MNIVTKAEIKVLELEANDLGLSEDTLINRAGLLIASFTHQRLQPPDGVVVLVGSGNNGSDGIVAALHLHQLGHEVLLYICNHRSSQDPYLEGARETGINIIEAVEDTEQSNLKHSVNSSAVVIDAVIGTGRNRPLNKMTS